MVVLLLSSSAVGAPAAEAQSGSSTGGAIDVVEHGSERRPQGPPRPHVLDGRSRFEMRLGVSDLSVHHSEWTDAWDVAGGDFSLAFVHWAHENLALEVSLGASNIGVSSRQTIGGETVRADGLYRVMAGGRFYLPVKGAFRPHVDLAGGLVTEVEVRDNPWRTDVTGRTTKAGLEVGGGVDFLLGGHFVVGVHAGTIVREGYRSRLNVGCRLGWAFGGRPQG